MWASDDNEDLSISDANDALPGILVNATLVGVVEDGVSVDIVIKRRDDSGDGGVARAC